MLSDKDKLNIKPEHPPKSGYIDTTADNAEPAIQLTGHKSVTSHTTNLKRTKYLTPALSPPLLHLNTPQHYESKKILSSDINKIDSQLISSIASRAISQYNFTSLAPKQILKNPNTCAPIINNDMPVYPIDYEDEWKTNHKEIVEKTTEYDLKQKAYHDDIIKFDRNVETLRGLMFTVMCGTNQLFKSELCDTIYAVLDVLWNATGPNAQELKASIKNKYYYESGDKVGMLLKDFVATTNTPAMHHFLYSYNYHTEQQDRKIITPQSFMEAEEAKHDTPASSSSSSSSHLTPPSTPRR